MIASSITPRPVEWLWWPYIPYGKLTVVAGQMGQAKSLFTLWLAALVSNEHGSAVILSAEDDPEDTVRPRLEAAGANLERVWIEATAALEADRLNTICDQLGDVRSISVDPITAYLPGNVNSWKSQDVRRALEPIRQLSAERGIATVLVQHINRRTDAGDPLTRIADSQGIPQLARSVLVWGPDPADPEQDRGTMKALTRGKGNLARATASATFTIAERTVSHGIKAPALTRGGDREITADDVIADAETRTAVDEATEWLLALLADGPVAAKDGTRKAREVGISDRTLKRAKRAAGVHSEASRDESGIRAWEWSLDVHKHTDPLDPLGPLGPLPQEANGANGANSANHLDAQPSWPEVGV